MNNSRPFLLFPSFPFHLKIVWSTEKNVNPYNLTSAYAFELNVPLLPALPVVNKWWKILDERHERARYGAQLVISFPATSSPTRNFHLSHKHRAAQKVVTYERVWWFEKCMIIYMIWTQVLLAFRLPIVQLNVVKMKGRARELIPKNGPENDLFLSAMTSGFGGGEGC